MGTLSFESKLDIQMVQNVDIGRSRPHEPGVNALCTTITDFDSLANDNRIIIRGKNEISYPNYGSKS